VTLRPLLRQRRAPPTLAAPTAWLHFTPRSAASPPGIAALGLNWPFCSGLVVCAGTGAGGGRAALDSPSSFPYARIEALRRTPPQRGVPAATARAEREISMLARPPGMPARRSLTIRARRGAALLGAAALAGAMAAAAGAAPAAGAT